MFYFSKIAPIFISPIMALFYFAFLSLILKSRKTLIIMISIMILITNPIFANYLISNIEKSYSPQRIDSIKKAEAIVVLSGMIGSFKNGGIEVVEWGRPNRYFSGIELLKANAAPLVVFTGGRTPLDPDGFNEGQYLKNKAISEGIPIEKILVTGEAYNTEQEAKSLSLALREKNIILVTSAFHMERAKFLFQSFGFNVIPFPVDYMSSEDAISVLSFFPNADALLKIDLYIHESIGRLFYKVKSLFEILK